MPIDQSAPDPEYPPAPEVLALAAKRLAEEIRILSGGMNACIFAARAMMDIASHLGFEAKPLPCKMVVWNDIWLKWVSMAKREPDPSEVQRIIECGGWANGIGLGYMDDKNAAFGYDGTRPAYNGHLVVIVNRKWLVDVTLEQASQPARGILLGPLVTRITHRGFLHGTQFLASAFSWSERPVHITYAAVPGDRTYRRTPDWNERMTRESADRILAALPASAGPISDVRRLEGRSHRPPAKAHLLGAP